MRSNPLTISVIRSGWEQALKTHFVAPAARAAMPGHAVIEIHATCSQEPSSGGFSSNAMPAGSSTKTNGTTKAGSVYFHDCSVVLYGSPPVIAAAANGDNAVGGETSDSTAQ